MLWLNRHFWNLKNTWFLYISLGGSKFVINIVRSPGTSPRSRGRLSDIFIFLQTFIKRNGPEQSVRSCLRDSRLPPAIAAAICLRLPHRGSDVGNKIVPRSIFCFGFFLLFFENNLFLWDCYQIRKQNFWDHIFFFLFASVCLGACLCLSGACVDGRGICEIQVQKPGSKNEVLAVQK